MYRIGIAVLICLLVACGGKDEKGGEGAAEDSNSIAGLSSRFNAGELPYQLADTALLNHKGKDTLSSSYINSLVPDTVISKIFGKTKGVRYAPLAKVAAEKKEAYFIVKASSGAKKAALLLVFDKSGSFGAALPFLVPDDKEATSQISSLDKSYTITKAVSQRGDNVVPGEGREVLAYDAAEKRFSLIMTDLLSDVPAVLVNPLDTFPKKNRLSGDYYADKKNIIAVRDGRHANQILVYIHTENSDRTCVGELKGEFILTGSSTAVYKQGGDPCGLSLLFTANTVSINEESGCGNYRGLDCPFVGKFTRKKEEKPRETTKKTRRTKQSR